VSRKTVFERPAPRCQAGCVMWLGELVQPRAGVDAPSIVKRIFRRATRSELGRVAGSLFTCVVWRACVLPGQDASLL
jgi:hypothetical protein